MKRGAHIPLLAKVFGWLCLHLVILGLAFAGFIRWQLELGLDSLLSGSAGERLRILGDTARSKLDGVPRSEWSAALKDLGAGKNVLLAVYDPAKPGDYPRPVPNNIMERARISLPPGPGPGPPVRRGPPPPARRGPPEDPDFPDDRPPAGFQGFEDGPPVDGEPLPGNADPRGPAETPPSQPVFLMRGSNGDGYWAGVRMVLPAGQRQPRRPELLLIRADGLDGSGMFFEFKPWLWGALAVLGLSLALWTPFVWSITGYVRRLTVATDRIAAGRFSVSLPSRGNDELGSLGNAIETMAARLDHLVTGQKRFLGDAAHELCAPLARLRTGLGILEMKLGASEQAYLAQIESDTQELATLVEEILAFSRSGNRLPKLQVILLEPLVHEVAAREGGGAKPEIHVAADLTVVADPALLARALANLVRNCRLHAGPDAHIEIKAASAGADFVEITVADNGPGVPAHELARLFEPFYRPDRSRSRDTGGSGLGLAIVRSAIEAAGGEVTATLPAGGGFAVVLRLRKTIDEATRSE